MWSGWDMWGKARANHREHRGERENTEGSEVLIDVRLLDVERLGYGGERQERITESTEVRERTQRALRC
jgi:hypothetical protein